MFNLICGVAAIGLIIATSVAGLHVAQAWSKPSENPQVIAVAAVNQLGDAQLARAQGQPLPKGWSYAADGRTATRAIPFESCGVINAQISGVHECPACDEASIACVADAGPVARAL